MSYDNVKVAVILPSRGLIFSQTAEEILNNLKGIPHRFFFAHRKPIPECFEKPVEAALSDDSITHLWFVEEDMILPQNTLKRLLERNKAVVVVDYPTTGGGGVVFKVKNEIIFGGTGCTLVKKEVFDELKKPYFTTDICWNIKNFGDFIKIVAVPRGGVKDGYGLHDVNFFMNLYRIGIPVHGVAFTVGQRRLVKLGEPGTNNGAHQIKEIHKFRRDDLLKKVKQWPIEQKGSLTTVLTPTGEVTVSHSHAKILIEKGLATLPPKRAVVVDDSEL